MLHNLNIGIGEELPRQFTNPFCYEPHPLCVAAAEQVKAYLAEHTEWSEEVSRGKMFGVLVVRGHDASGATTVGFLAAYSGLLAGRGDHDYFVPLIYDYLLPEGYFQREQAEISQLSQRIAADSSLLSSLGVERRSRSEALQDWLFDQYIISNARDEEKSLTQIFLDYYRETMIRRERFLSNARRHHIPSGTGDCCAPKLLQYAYRHHLQPVCMAEFWLGQTPRDEIRHNGQFYPACNKKCRPLLNFMLQGLDVEESMLDRLGEKLLNSVTIVYEDADIVVIDKPSGLLSVPSRDSEVCVLDWCRRHYTTEQKQSNQIQPTPVHRLDQDTSGLLIIAKNHDALTGLQSQFYHHRVVKTYEALLDGRPEQMSGDIDLPLSRDPIDSPRQIVDYEHGKASHTHYDVVSVKSVSHDADSYISHRETYITRIRFQPSTGRTHQLRVHSAHPLGLKCPIVGDKLYGRHQLFVNPSGYKSLLGPRLMLHASEIEFQHPITGQPIHLVCKVPF